MKTKKHRPTPFGKLLKQYRAELGWTTQQMAKFLDVNRVTVENLEAGKGKTNPHRLWKIGATNEIERVIASSFTKK